MAKLFEIPFTPSNVMSDVRKSSVDDSFVSVREIELSMLESVYLFAASASKDFKKSNLCYDVVEQLKNLTDKDVSIRLTPEDLELFKNGYEACVNSRPPSWYHARSLLKHMANPVEIKV